MPAITHGTEQGDRQTEGVGASRAAAKREGAMQTPKERNPEHYGGGTTSEGSCRNRTSKARLLG
jgi:hypothetical protein